MPTKPIISIIGASARTSGWMRLYSSLVWNTASFEVIFAGPCKPEYQLPANFYHIETDVKPTQCMHAAALRAKGAYLLNSGDDVYYNRYALDHLLNTFTEKENDKYFLTPLGDWIIYDPKDSKILAKRIGQIKHNYFFGQKTAPQYQEKNKFCPIMPHQGMFIKKHTYMELGVPDIRFVARFWDHDLAMRIYEKGGIGDVCVNAVFTETRLGWDDSILEPPATMPDEQLLYSLWCKSDNQKNRYSTTQPATTKNIIKEARKCNISILKQRSEKPQLFSDKDILLESQGDKGRWQ